MNMPAQKIEPEEVRAEVSSGKALLVCAYVDQEKCRNYPLTNALSLTDFKAQEGSLPKDRKIVFYCA